jgi:hypothetical protein
VAESAPPERPITRGLSGKVTRDEIWEDNWNSRLVRVPEDASSSIPGPHEGLVN